MKKFRAQVAKLKKGTHYQAASGGTFWLSDLEKTILPGITGANLFTYMFRRFGPATLGSDDYKSLCRYRITTPMPGLFLEVTPYVGRGHGLNFGYCLSTELNNAVMHEQDAPKKRLWRDAAKWYHETNIDMIPEPLREQKITPPDGGEPRFWYEIPEAMWCQANFDEWPEPTEMYPVWRAAIDAYSESFPEKIPTAKVDRGWGNLPDSSIERKCYEAFAAAMRDLLRPVSVRDVYFNCLGYVEDANICSLEKRHGNTAPYAKSSGYGVPRQFVEDPDKFLEAIDSARKQKRSSK
jgi:hypothetical protein